MITQIDVRNWVHDSVESFFKGEETLCEKYNILLQYDKDDGYADSTVYVKMWYNGKWNITQWFDTKRYYRNFWDEVASPWVCDYVTDITNEVMKFIEEPKKKEW